ncbi:MAG: hypothetical protein SVV80_02955, partial [Planctomycetota bacterium]|nr:hypothetical protein [Planctomycetota bacterium]
MRYTTRPGVVLFMVAVCSTVSLAQARLEIRSGIRPSLAPPTDTSGNEGIHIPAGRSTSSPWTTTDSLGYRWDILNNGTVSDGTNDAYDGGMQLSVNRTAFPVQPTARLSANGKEIEIGWRYNNLNISRRIFVNTKSGYCRWIDIFENTTGAEVAVSLRYYSNMGASTNRTQTTSGGTNVTLRDWGIVTSGSAGSNRPAVVHVFATSTAKFKPTFSFSKDNDSLYCDTSIKVPPNKAVALCFFEAQRKSFDQAVGFLKDFDPADELRLVPASLRKIVLNMVDAGLTTLGGVELKRDKKSDLLVLRNGNEIRGEITNDEYVLRADFGQVKIPSGAVIGLMGRSRANDRVRLVMTDGQVIAGELKSGPLTVELTGGTSLKIAPKEILQATFRISPEKPETITAADSLVVFRSGARLAFDGAEADFAFMTQHGVIKPSAGNLRVIEMDTPAGGLHRIVFNNGSMLAGLLMAERIRLKLKLGSSALTAGGSAALTAGGSAALTAGSSAALTEGGPTIEVSRRRLKQFVFPIGPTKS